MPYRAGRIVVALSHSMIPTFEPSIKKSPYNEKMNESDRNHRSIEFGKAIFKKLQANKS